jgi:cobalamin biosynthesis Mg chelatase CobN
MHNVSAEPVTHAPSMERRAQRRLEAACNALIRLSDTLTFRCLLRNISLEAAQIVCDARYALLVQSGPGSRSRNMEISIALPVDGTVRSLREQVALETRTRTLNPKWYEGMLAHGYEGVRQIEAHITNTLGWSATTGQVQPWVYQQLTQTFMLDPEMRDRLARLNPTASAKLANRLLEASDRKFWMPDAKTLQALRQAGEELEDRLEGIYEGVAS